MACIDVSQFSDLCRICGSKTSVLMGLHIFEREGDLRQIHRKIKDCLPVQIHNNDKLPKMVCEECVYKLDLLAEFREKSLKTEAALNEMLKDLFPPVTDVTIELPDDTTVVASQLSAYIVAPVSTTSSSVKADMKCDSEVFIKVEDQIVGGGGHAESDSESDTDSDSDSDSDESLVGCTDIQNNASMVDQNLADNQLNGPIMAINANKEDNVTTNGSYLLTDQDEQPAWFFCNICGKAFASRNDFQLHYEVHWNKCSLCGAVFTNESALLAHCKEMHPENTKLHGVLDYTANDIKAGLKKSADNKKGELKLLGDSKACPECGKEYRSNYKLSEHMRKHTGEKPFKCSSCEKAFRSKIGLAQHEAKHTGQYDYTCSSCGKGFQCKSYLIVHQRVHSDLKPYPCTTCGRNFKTKQSLLDHQNRHLGVKPYMCDTCGRGFITKGLCKSHQRVHSGTDNRQYPCTVCNKLFVSKSYLATHLRIHTGEKPFMCEVCGKGFLTRVDLRIHSTMHTGEKSFVCETCGKAFARRDALRCHRRSHTGERPYRCDICGQCFTQFSPMAIHKRLHTGERPYTCDVCVAAPSGEFSQSFMTPEFNSVVMEVQHPVAE